MIYRLAVVVDYHAAFAFLEQLGAFKRIFDMGIYYYQKRTGGYSLKRFLG